MNCWTPPQLLDLAIQSLLRDEASAVQALNELPVDLFPPVLTAAFRGKHRKVVRALVQAWPFPQLSLAPLLVDPRSCQDSLWAVLDGLDARPARGVQIRKSKLRLVDFRPHFELIQSNDSSEDAARSLSSFATWMEPEVTLPETKPRQRRSCKKKPWQGWQPVDLYINLSLGTIHRRELFFCVLRKVKQSCRPLRLFCRQLHIKDMPILRIVEILNLLQLEFIQELEMCGCFGLLSGGSRLARQVEQMQNLCSVKVSHPVFGTSSVDSQPPSDAFVSFLSHLSKLRCLRILHLSSEHISGHLRHLVSYLPASLETLELPSCVLDTDIYCLSRSPLASHLKKLDLSHNDLSDLASGVLEALLREASGTLQELVLEDCNMSDIHLLALLPALNRCFHLHSLHLCGNHIWKSSLVHLIQLVAGLSELKLVACPLPTECYKYEQGMYNLQSQQVNSVKAMVWERLRALRRENLEWTFTLPNSWCWNCQSI